MLPVVRTFPSLSLMISIVDESRTHRHKEIGRLFFISPNIDDYNIELPHIYIVLPRSKSFGKSPHTNGLESGFLLLLSF